MTPETKARLQIDQKLEQAGWVIQDMKQLDLSAGIGVAVREYPTDSGPADYLLFAINLDQVTFAGFSEQAETQAKATIQNFTDYIHQHKDEIAALSFFYQQPYQRRALTFDMIEELHEHLSRPPLMLTTERLWSAYARVKGSLVKGATTRRQLTDLVSLLRFALELDGAGAELKPFADELDRRFQTWIFRHDAQRGTSFTQEQSTSNSLNESLSIESDDQTLYWKPMGIAFSGQEHNKKLSQEGAAELLWSLLISPIQQH